MEVSQLRRGKLSGAIISRVHLFDMTSFFSDRESIYSGVRKNPLIYEIHEIKREKLSYATTILFPGKIGKEFFMTRGHMHTSPDPEIYHVISGKGILLCENSRFVHTTLMKGSIAYVTGDMNHRMVNIGRTPFVFLAIYATGAGHDYSHVEAHGFSRRVVSRKGGWGFVKRVGKQI